MVTTVEQSNTGLATRVTAAESDIADLQAVGASGAQYTSGGPVACATTANITLSGEQTLDGVTTSTDRVLVKDQTDASENGIYVSAAGAWSRATDMDAAGEVAGTAVRVSGGSTSGGRIFVTYSAVTTLDTDDIDWVDGGDISGQQDQIDATNTDVARHSGAIYRAVRMGTDVTPLTGSNLGSRTIVPEWRVTQGKWQLDTFAIYLMSSGTVTLRRFDAVSGAQIGSDIDLTCASGLNTFAAADLPSQFAGDAGEVLGFYAPSVAYQASGAPGRGCIAASGDLTTITLTPETAFRSFFIEAYFTIDEAFTTSAAQTMRSRLNGGVRLSLPDDFWYLPFEVGVAPDGYAAHSYHPQDVCPIASPSDADYLYYVDPVSGDDSTGDGSSGTPYKSLYKALHNVTGSVWVRFNGNLEYGTNGVGATLVADAIVIEGIDGADTISERFGSLTWSLVGGTSATYSATAPATVGAVFDENDADADDGYATPLTLDGGYSSGELTAGEYAISGSTVYVRTANDDDLSSDDSALHVMGTGRHFDIDEETELVLWMDGVNIHGGEAVWMDTSAGIERPLAYINNGNLMYGSGSDDFIHNYTQVGVLGLYNCNIVDTYSDAAGYQNGAAFEIDCNFYRCGEREAGGASNASSGHGSSTQVRLATRADRGIYQAYGRPIHDISTSKTFQIGIMAGPSTSTGAEADRVAYTFSNSAEAWLVNCRVDPAAHRSVGATDTAIVNVYGLRENGVAPLSTSIGTTPLWPYGDMS